MNKSKLILFVFLAAILVTFDQITKYLIRTSGGFYICNTNLAFGLPLSLIIIPIVLLIIISFFKIEELKIKKLVENCKLKIENYNSVYVFSIILIIAGSLSNIIDRLMHGCVIDFIDLKFWPVFNLADIYISAGAILLLLSVILSERSEQKNL